MVATVRNLTSSSATSEYFRQDGGYYLVNDEDAADLRAKRAEHRNASAWHGQGAVALGLHPGKPVGARAFEELLQGHVIGTKLRLGRLRDGQHEHRPGFDITFSAPKSVSLAALLPTEEHPHGDRAVISAHNAAVRETLDWIEGTLLETRGWDPVTRRRPRVKAPCMVAALFRHIASRNLDPQLHTHAVIANMTRDGEGRWKSVEPTLLHRNARLIGAYYRDRLARQLMAKGHSILPAMVGRLPSFELAGYGRELREAFSTRRHEILAYVDDKGWDRGAAAMQAATLATRKRKAEPVRAQLQERWLVRAQELDLDKALAEARSGRPIMLPEGPSTLELVRRCMRQLEERQSVFAEHALEALALGHSPGLHSIGDIRDAVAWMVRDGHLVEAELRRADRAFVTNRALKAERSTIALMKAGTGAGETLAREKDVVIRLEGAGLTEGQEEAVRTILLARDRIVGVQGRAGTGKTTMLRQVAELAGERPVIGLAPSTAAAAVLGRETGIQGSTAEGVIAVLDSSHGALTDQSTFYVEISRARERAVVLTDNAEELVRVLAENTGERPTAIEAVDAPLDLEPEEIVRLLAEEDPVWTPREDWEALERRARREGTVLFLVEGYGELIADAEQLAENPDLPAVTREVVAGLLAYDRACREGDRAAVEFLGLLDAHDAGRRGLDKAAEKAKCPVAGLEDYPAWREMSGRLSANGEILLAALGERAGEAGSGISRRLGELADLLAVDDAVLAFDTRRRAVAARAEANETIPFYAEGHGDLVERATHLARRSPLPAWALAAAREVLDQAETCKERRAAIVALHDDAVGLLAERTKLEDRAREAGGSVFTPPTELEGYAGWLARCGEVGERWCAIRRATREDTRTWRPHLDRLKDEAGKIAAAVERFDRLGEHDPAWKQVFETRLTMAEREKAGSVISFYQQGWEELVEEARAFGRRKGLPDQARALVKRVLGYDRRLRKERATVDGFLEDAEKHRQHRDPLEEEARHRVQQDPDFLVTDLPGYRTIPRVPDKLQARGRAIREKEDTYGPHLDRIPGGRQKLADALEWMERHHLLDRFVSVMDRIEKTKRSLQERGVSLAGDEGYDGAIAKAERLAKEPDLEEEARRRLRAAIAEHASLAIEWREIESLFREAEALDTRYRQLEERAAREDVPRSMLTEWQALQERSHRFEKAAHWALIDDRIQDYRQIRPDTFQGIEEGLRLARERRRIPDLEDGRIAEMVGAELARLRDPGAGHAFTRSWAAQEPLLAGDRIRLQLTDDGPQPEAVVRQPGWTGGRTRHDMVELEWVAVPQGGKHEEPDTRMSGPKLAGRVHRAEWSDERLREVERARQFPAPPAKFPFASAKGVTRGDVLCRTEVAALDPAAPESSRLGRPAVVRIGMEVVEITAAKTEGEDQCRLRERWRSDDEPCREFSLLLGHLSAFARARAFWNSSEDERWSKAHAQKTELDERRIVLNQPGPHYSWSRARP